MSFLTTSDTVTSSDPATSLPDAGGDLSSTSVLRLVRSGLEPQSWSLPIGRCTLGSSRQCQVHLPDDQVRPLHCLIVHSTDETFVTRWAPGALLNGEDFSTAPFQSGDQLTIGNIELQLVADDTQTPPADQQEAAPTAPTREVAPTPPPLVEQERPVSPPQPAVMPTGKSAEESASVVPPQWQRDRMVRRLWLANFNARGRCRQLIGSMRVLRTQSSGFDQQIDALRRQLHCALDERQQLAGELEQRQAEMVERDQQATAEMDRLVSELSTAHERAKASESAVSDQALADERLQEEIASLASQYEQLELAQAQDEKNRILLSQEVADRDLKIKQLQRQLEQTKASNISFAEQSAELADSLERLQAELDRERTERRGLAEEQAALGNQLRELEQDLADREQTIGELHQRLERSEESGNANAKQSAELAITVERLQHELDQQRTEREGLGAERAALGNQLKELEQNLADREQTIGELHQRLEQSAELAGTVERLQAELDRERSERSGLADEQVTLGNQLRELEQNLADREQTIGDLHQQLEQAHESARQIDEHSAKSIEEQSAKYVATIENLQDELKQKDTQRAHLEELQTEFTGRRQELEESLAERDRAIEDLKCQLYEADQAANVAREGEAAHAGTIEALQAELNQQQAERDTLGVAGSNTSDRLEELENALAERERQLKELRQEHEDVCQTLHCLEQGSFEQVDACKRLEEELAGLRTERDELAAVQSGHDGQLRALEEGLTQRDRAIEELNEQLSAVTQRRVEMESEVARHAETYRNLEVEAEKLRERCQSLTDEQTVSCSQQHELQQSIAGYDEHIGALTAELESVRQEHQTLQKAAEEQSGSREGLIAELAELRELHEDTNQKYEAEFERRQTADREVAQREYRIEMLEVDLRGIQIESKQFSEKLALSEQARATAEEPLTQLREEVEILTTRQDSLAEKNSQVRQQRDELAMELETARQELLQLQQHAETVSSEASTHAEQLVALEQAKFALEEEKSGLKQEKSALEQANSALEERLATEQNLASELSSELEQTRDQHHEGQLQRQQSEALHQESQSELAAAKECLLAAEQALQNAATKDSTLTARLSEDLEPESPDPVANDSAAEEAIEHLRELSVWSDKEKPSTLEDNNQSAEAEAGASEFKPTSFIGQHGHMFNEDAPVESSSDSTFQSAGPETSDSSISAGPHDDSGDAALEDYMSSLMRRVSGGSNSSSTYVEPQYVTPSNQPTASDEEASPQGSLGLETQAEAEIVEPLDLNSLKNASKKPPMPTDMRAMRELANSSARQAIAKYSKRRHLESGFSTFLVCGISTGVAAYMMLVAESFQSPQFLGGLIPAFAGLLWGVKLLGILLDSIREGSWHKSKPTEISIDESPLPIDGHAELDSSND